MVSYDLSVSNMSIEMVGCPMNNMNNDKQIIPDVAHDHPANLVGPLWPVAFKQLRNTHPC